MSFCQELHFSNFSQVLITDFSLSQRSSLQVLLIFHLIMHTYLWATCLTWRDWGGKIREKKVCLCETVCRWERKEKRKGKYRAMNIKSCEQTPKKNKKKKPPSFVSALNRAISFVKFFPSVCTHDNLTKAVCQSGATHSPFWKSPKINRAPRLNPSVKHR